MFATKSLQAKKKWMSSMAQCVERLKDAKVGPPQIAPRSSAPSSDLPPIPASAAELASPGPAVSSRPRPNVAPPSSGKGAASASSSGASTPKGKMSYEQWAPVGGKEAPVDAPPPVPHPKETAGMAKGSGDEAWFAGKMPRGKAEKILTALPDGSYLVRESDSRPGDYSLSIKFGQVKHIKVNREGNKYELAPDAKSFPSIHELVDHFQQHSLNRHFPGMETCLEIPFRNAATYASAKATLGSDSKFVRSARDLQRQRQRDREDNGLRMCLEMIVLDACRALAHPFPFAGSRALAAPGLGLHTRQRAMTSCPLSGAWSSSSLVWRSRTLAGGRACFPRVRYVFFFLFFLVFFLGSCAHLPLLRS